MNVENSKATSLHLVLYYLLADGKPVTLEQMGVNQAVQTLVTTNGKLGKLNQESLHSAFIRQILNGERLNFKNGYRLMEEREVWQINNPLWAIGGVVISGSFDGEVIQQRGNYFLVGQVNYALSDEFSKPLDLTNTGYSLLQTEFGTPFSITGSWTEPVNIMISKQQYEKVKTLLNSPTP
ncbi:hypothetical protein BKK47_02850 [Rodentibacter mrazii]|uniref:Uncharacterized protein n=1 Tax=Rodentibacter mrazii TaxID=1908257 RepID=A0A1V3IIQ0_9PAST|nr:hypothetical protein BKK47_02850 [Rodentibacter mrazii]